MNLLLPTMAQGQGYKLLQAECDSETTYGVDDGDKFAIETLPGKRRVQIRSWRQWFFLCELVCIGVLVVTLLRRIHSCHNHAVDPRYGPDELSDLPLIQAPHCKSWRVLERLGVSMRLFRRWNADLAKFPGTRCYGGRTGNSCWEMRVTTHCGEDIFHVRAIRPLLKCSWLINVLTPSVGTGFVQVENKKGTKEKYSVSAFHQLHCVVSQM